VGDDGDEGDDAVVMMSASKRRRLNTHTAKKKAYKDELAIYLRLVEDESWSEKLMVKQVDGLLKRLNSERTKALEKTLMEEAACWEGFARVAALMLQFLNSYKKCTFKKAPDDWQLAPISGPIADFQPLLQEYGIKPSADFQLLCVKVHFAQHYKNSMFVAAYRAFDVEEVMKIYQGSALAQPNVKKQATLFLLPLVERSVMEKVKLIPAELTRMDPALVSFHQYLSESVAYIPDLSSSSDTSFPEKRRADLLKKQTSAAANLVQGYLSEKTMIDGISPRPSEVRMHLACLLAEPKTRLGLAFDTYKGASKWIGRVHDALRTSTAEDTSIVVMKNWYSNEVENHSLKLMTSFADVVDRLSSYKDIVVKISESLPILRTNALEEISNSTLKNIVDLIVECVELVDAFLTKEVDMVGGTLITKALRH